MEMWANRVCRGVSPLCHPPLTKTTNLKRSSIRNCSTMLRNPGSQSLEHLVGCHPTAVPCSALCMQQPPPAS